MRDDVLLADLTMPASHDAGVNERHSTGVGWGSKATELSEAQDLELRDQMDVGVRFFDLRPCLVKGTLRTCHIAHDDVLWDEVGGCYGESLKSAFDAAREFLGAHPRETLIFKISHWDYPVDGSSGDKTKAQDQFFNDFVYGYGSILLKWDTARDGALPRLNALPLKKARGKLIVVCGGVSGRISQAKGTWGYSDGTASAGYLGVYDSYANTDDFDKMKSDQINKWASQNSTANTSRAFLLSWTLTMQTDFLSILEGIFAGSIEDFADKANPRLSSVLSTQVAAGYKRPTFVLLDYVSATYSSVIVPYNEPNERRPEATVSVGTAVSGKVYSEMTVPVTAQVVDYGLTATSAKVVVTLTPASGGTSLAKDFTIGGDLNSHDFSAAFTGLKAGTKYNVTASVTIGGAVVKSAASTLTTGYPPPEAKVSVGTVTVGRDFATATVPVTAQVTEYGAAKSAKVVVTLTPVGGGSKVTNEFALGGDTAAHQFSAAFDGLTAGGRYDVTAKVVVGDSSGWNDAGKFAAADAFTWFDERATSFSAAKWTGAGETVRIRDGALIISNGEDSETTFAPEKKTVCASRIVFKFCKFGAYTASTLPIPDGPVAISAILDSEGKFRLVVWGGGKWNATEILFTDEAANFDVVVNLDFRNHNVKYSVGGRTLGTYSLPNTFGTVSSIAFEGYSVLSELVGAAEDANLVRDGNGNEYATFADAMNAGATGVLSPLWLSTWSLSGFSGVFDVRDPNGLITYAKGTQTVQTENLGGGVVRTWYVQLSDADIRAGANKYLKNTAELGLVKAITDGSAVRIGDYLVVNGTMSFVVEIDDVAVAKEAVKKLVQVKSALTDEWRQPADADIGFENGRVVVTPNRGGASGFARVRIP